MTVDQVKVRLSRRRDNSENALQVNAIRDRAWHYINPDVASAAGMSLAQLQQFVNFTRMPSDEQLQRLARCIGVKA